jgi:hypothetical protein
MKKFARHPGRHRLRRRRISDGWKASETAASKQDVEQRTQSQRWKRGKTASGKATSGGRGKRDVDIKAGKAVI